MALSSGRRRRDGSGLEAWPGYVDALSTLLMVIIFVLMVFVLAQGFLSVALSSRDRALDRLNRQVAELAEMLALERGQAGELRNALSRTAEELRAAAEARDTLSAQLRETREERERLVADRDAARADRDRLTARLTDLDLAARGSGERIAALEAQLADALRRAEAAGGDAAQTVRRLTETGRNLAAERTARQQAETQLAEARGAVETARRELANLHQSLAEAQAQLESTRQQVAAMRAEMAALDRQVQADRATIETRLADIARLSEQIRALSALRDQLERQAAEAARRAGDEAQRRSTAEAAAGSEAERRAAAERTAAAEGERRRAAEAIAQEEAQRRQAAERAGAEQTRLAESARVQVALLTRQIEELRNQIARVAAALDAAEAAGRDKDAQIASLGTRLNAALAARVEELQRYRSDFFGRLRDVLGDRPEVRIVGDRFVFQSEVLFPPASAELSSSGQQQIREIARVLQEIAARIPPDVNWLLRVDGHADRLPIRSARFASNWELSAARAIAVSQLLMAEGLPPNRVAATAFGDNQPLDPGDSPEALARNRRIELRLTDR
ncbi:peptidoglycan -binding protein [Siccirubricoccus sp. KC 17139]|uniref:Peptidoglycan -binding protein n=1 Tax=Siccirubricoccus soli TaxID=2899147 RepID=A0ABT1D8I4_9PROT|nr:peptidoglycan -binding protein [Siccirubricoccus soli]MCP2684385.1 peptidoglycan -binding protein [Siccirubricoccus soli]